MNGRPMNGRPMDKLPMKDLAACVLAAICARYPASTPEESYEKCKRDIDPVVGCTHHWEDVVKWFKTGEWPGTQVSTVAYELNRLAAISRANKLFGKAWGCETLLKLMGWSPKTTSA